MSEQSPTPDETRWASAILNAQKYGRSATDQDKQQAGQIMARARRASQARKARKVSPLEEARALKAMEVAVAEAQGINDAREGELPPAPEPVVWDAPVTVTPVPPQPTIPAPEMASIQAERDPLDGFDRYRQEATRAIDKLRYQERLATLLSLQQEGAPDAVLQELQNLRRYAITMAAQGFKAETAEYLARQAEQDENRAAAEERARG